jgi:hypothetical protein
MSPRSGDWVELGLTWVPPLQGALPGGRHCVHRPPASLQDAIDYSFEFPGLKPWASSCCAFGTEGRSKPCALSRRGRRAETGLPSPPAPASLEDAKNSPTDESKAAPFAGMRVPLLGRLAHFTISLSRKSAKGPAPQGPNGADAHQPGVPIPGPIRTHHPRSQGGPRPLS